jgi:hypothetical protein
MRFRSPELEGVSSHNQTLGCPQCQRRMELVALRDGEQAYWCHTCQRGWRAGHLPPESRLKRSKSDSSTDSDSGRDAQEAGSSRKAA